MNGLVTDEYSKNNKSKVKIFFLILIFLVVIAGIVLLCFLFFNNKSKKKEKTTEIDISSSLNPELSNTYLFAVDNDGYIVSIKKDGKVFKIYNLLQGTGTLGEFKTFTYFDKKLYLMFSNNTIYTISLAEGNKSYQLKKLVEYSPLLCGDMQVIAGDDLSIYKDFIYFNNSNCGVDMYYSGTKENVDRLHNIKSFNGRGVYVAYNKSTSSLYFYSINDSKIYRFNEKDSDVTVLIDNVKTDTDISIISNVLIYTQKNVDGTYDYYGYNLNNGQNTLIVKNALGLVKYKNGFVYYTNSKIVYLDGTKENVIYNAHYDKLSDFELIGKDMLQVVDSNISLEKTRIINIDLSNKNKTIIVSNKYKNIHFFEDIEKSGVSN